MSGPGLPTLHECDRRHASHYLRRLKQIAAGHAQGGASTENAVAEMDQDWPQISKGQQWAAEHDAEATLGYMKSGNRLLMIRRSPVEWRKWLEDGCRAAAEQEDLILFWWSRLQIGNVAFELGEYEEAVELFQEALDDTAAGELRVERAGCLRSLGNGLQRLGRTEEALRAYEEALSLARELGDRAEEGSVLGMMGVLHAEQDAHEEAISCYRQALAIHAETGDERERAIFLGNLGNVYHAQGRNEEALACFEGSLDHYERLGDRGGQATRLHNIGRVQLALGRLDLAEQHLGRGLELRQALEDRYGEATWLTTQGDLLEKRGRRGEAIAVLQRAEALFAEMGQPHLAARTGKSARALETRPAREEIQRLADEGMTAIERGALDQAAAAYSRGLELATEAQHGYSQSLCVGNLAYIDLLAGRYECAIERYERALALEPGPNDLTTNFLLNLAGAYIARKMDAEAVRCYRAARDLLDSNGDTGLRAQVLTFLANLGAGCSAPEEVEAWRRSARELYASILAHRDETAQQFGTVIDTIARAAAGNLGALQRAEAWLDMVAKGPWTQLPARVRQLWRGDRDWHHLCGSLGPEQSLLLLLTLERLGSPRYLDQIGLEEVPPASQAPLDDSAAELDPAALSCAEKVPLTCPCCSARFTRAVWLVVDVEERPEFVDRCRAGRARGVSCPAGHVLLLDAPVLVYHRSWLSLLLVPARSAWRNGLRPDVQMQVGRELLVRLLAALPPERRGASLGAFGMGTEEDVVSQCA